MEDVKQTKVALVLEPAEVDGFLVRETFSPQMVPVTLFAGTLSHCLAFMESRMRPVQKTYAPESPDVIRVGDLTQAEIKQGYADAKRAAEPGVVRATQVDLRDISAPGFVDTEWDAGAAAARKWAERRAQAAIQDQYESAVRAAEANHKAVQDTIRERLIREFSVSANLTYLCRREITQAESLVILAALRQQDAQNAGKAP